MSRRNKPYYAPNPSKVFTRDEAIKLFSSNEAVAVQPPQTTNYAQLHQQVTNLQLALDAAQKRIAELEALTETPPTSTPPFPSNHQATQTDPDIPFRCTTATQTDPHATHTDPPANPTKKPNPKPTFATIAAKNTPTKPPRRQPPMPISRALRFITTPDPDTPTGYSFVYINKTGRCTPAQVRQSLTALGVTTNRILDIHYPTHNVAALLVHNVFRPTLISILQPIPRCIIPNFDPISPNILRDPKFSTLPPAERQAQTMKIHGERLGRILHRLSPRLQPSVTHSFLALGMHPQQPSTPQPDHPMTD